MSTHHLRITIIGIVAAAIAALVLVATGTGEVDDASGGHDDDPTATVDWASRTAHVPHDRWTVEFCEGDAPVMCLTDADGAWGGIELSSWDTADLDVLEAAFADGATAAEALDAFAEEFLTTLRADRAEGCGPEYQFTPDASTSTTVAGLPGLRYGFRGIVRGETVEHVVGHAVITDGTLHLFNASGLADDGCLGREGEFPMEAFDAETVDLIGRIAAASTLP